MEGKSKYFVCIGDTHGKEKGHNCLADKWVFTIRSWIGIILNTL